MIKIGFRHNIIYLIMLIFFNFLRKIDSIIMAQGLKFDSSLLFILLMFLSESIAGFILYTKENNFLSEKQNKPIENEKKDDNLNQVSVSSTSLSVDSSLIYVKKVPTEIKPLDNNFKIYLLLFIATFFDFIEFIINTYFLPKYNDKSRTLDLSLSSLIFIFSLFSLIFY